MVPTRRLIKALITGQPLGDYSTVEDEVSIEEIKKAVKSYREEVESISAG